MKSKFLIATSLFWLLTSATSHAQTGICATAEDVANLQPRHWCEVPNSNLSTAEKNPSEYDDWDGASSAKYNSYQRVMGVLGVTAAWNSGAFDTKRNCLLVMGGGHNDYGGNEVYKFCLGNLAWNRVTDPTTFPNRHPAYQNADLTPISRHTYGGLAYSEAEDRFFVSDGGPDSDPGVCGLRGTWTFDLSARDAAGTYSPSQWELRTSENEPERSCENVMAYSSKRNKIILKSASSTNEFDFQANTWSKVSDNGRRNGKVSLAVDTDRNLLVEVGGGVTALWSIDDGFSGGAVSTSGVTGIEGADDPGLVYDERLQRIVGWSGGTSVYTFDTNSRVWTAIAPAATNAADPGPVKTSGGVFGRFNYSPALNLYIYVGLADSNVMLYRLSDGEPLVAPLPPVDLVTD